MISYLHITSSKVGIFIGPTEIVLMDPDNGEFYSDDTIAFSTKELQILKVGDLMGDGGQIVIIGVNIPRHSQNFEEFSAVMHRTEIVLQNNLIRFNLRSI